MDIPGTIAAVTGAIEIAKHIRQATSAFNEAELRFHMAELTSALTDAKLALAEAQRELAGKDQEIERLKTAFARREETVEVEGLKYRISKQRNGPAGNPFCPRCLEVDGRLMLTLRGSKGLSNVFCPECKTNYPQVRTYVE